MDVIPDKNSLRAHVRMQKKLLPMQVRQKEEREVWRAVESLLVFVEARHVLLYHSLPDELSTRMLFERWHSMGKTLYLPVVVGDDLVVRSYTPATMQQGAYGIYEPQGSEVDEAEIELIVVPGVAFDAAGNRLGRGKGYYDRLLSRTHAVKVGVCYNCQLLPNIPAFPHDCRMDYVVTPQGVYR